MSYEKFELEDFLSEERFQNWVKDGTDEQFWSDWLKHNPSKKETVQQAAKILEGVAINKNSVRTEKINSSWEELEHQLTNSDTRPVEDVQIPLENRKNYWIRYAAAIALLIGLIVVFFSDFEPSQTTYKTGFGEKEKIQLDDGTKILLNSNSELIAFDSWDGNKDREVDLIKGEAFFEVERKELSQNQKFIVHSEDLVIEVLGTEFNVLSRRGKTKIALVSGSVKLLQKSSQSKVMQPGDYYKYSHENKFIEVDKNPGNSSISWTKNEIILDESSLEEIVLMLEDRFGKKIDIQNEGLKTRKLSGRVSDQDLNLILDVVKSSLGVQIEKTHTNTILIK